MAKNVLTGLADDIQRGSTELGDNVQADNTPVLGGLRGPDVAQLDNSRYSGRPPTNWKSMIYLFGLVDEDFSERPQLGWAERWVLTGQSKFFDVKLPGIVLQLYSPLSFAGACTS